MSSWPALGPRSPAGSSIVGEEKTHSALIDAHAAALMSPRWLRLSTPNTRTRQQVDLELPAAQGAAAAAATTFSAGKPVPPVVHSGGSADSSAYSPRVAQALALDSGRVGSLTAAENTRVALVESRHALERKVHKLRLQQLPPLDGSDAASAAATISVHPLLQLDAEEDAPATAAQSLANHEKMQARRELLARQAAGPAAAAMAANEAHAKRHYTGRTLNEGVWLKQSVKPGDRSAITSAGQICYFKFLVLPVSSGRSVDGTSSPDTSDNEQQAAEIDPSAAEVNPYAKAVWPSLRVELEADCSGCSLRVLLSSSVLYLSSPLERGCSWWNVLDSRGHERSLSLHIKGGHIGSMTTGTHSNSPPTYTLHAQHGKPPVHIAPAAAPHGFTTSTLAQIPNYNNVKTLERFTSAASLTRSELSLIQSEGAIPLFFSVYATSSFRIRATSFAHSAASFQPAAMVAQRIGGRMAAGKELLGARIKRRNAAGAVGAKSKEADATQQNATGMNVHELSQLHDLKAAAGLGANARQALALRLTQLTQDPVALEAFQRRVEGIKTERQIRRARRLGRLVIASNGEPVSMPVRATYQRALGSSPSTAALSDGEGDPNSAHHWPAIINSIETNRLMVREGGEPLRSRHAAWVERHSERMQASRSNYVAREAQRRARAQEVADELARQAERIQDLKFESERVMTARERALWEEQQHELERQKQVSLAQLAAQEQRLVDYENSRQARHAARLRRREMEAAEVARLEEEAYQARRAALNYAEGLASYVDAANSRSGSYVRSKPPGLASEHIGDAADAGSAPSYATPSHHFTPAALRLADNASGGGPLLTDVMGIVPIRRTIETEQEVAARLRAQIEEGLSDSEHGFIQASLMAARAQAAREQAARAARARDAERAREAAERERDAALMSSRGGPRSHSRQGSISGMGRNGMQMLAALAAAQANASTSEAKSFSDYSPTVSARPQARPAADPTPRESSRKRGAVASTKRGGQTNNRATRSPARKSSHHR